MNKNASGPAIKARFFCDHGEIERIALEQSTDFTQWEIVSSDQDPNIELLINDWMNEYCSGMQPKKKIPLNLTRLPPYTQKVLNALQTLSFGESLTYQELAFLTHNPRACRAVGSACGRNPFPLLIPCHRVLAKDSIGGFAFGISVKQALLRFERKFSNII